MGLLNQHIGCITTRSDPIDLFAFHRLPQWNDHRGCYAG